jgi:putative hydrolase of the HAD superfamily
MKDAFPENIWSVGVFCRIFADKSITRSERNMNYKNIIFDLGNVIVKLDEGATMRAFEQLGLDKTDHIRENPEMLRLFQGMGLGLVSNKDFFDAFRKMTHQEVTDQQITDAVNAMLLYVPDVKKQKLLDLRKAGVRTFLLSNTIDLHWRYCIDHLFPMGPYGVTDYFERTFVSQEMHKKKPNDNIFQQAIQDAALNPSDTLFIDDLEVNCQAAERNGLHTFQNKEFDDWMKMLG